MSIVERAADLLGSALQSQRKPSTPVEGSDTRGPEVIERTVASGTPRPGLTKDKNLAGGADSATEASRSASRTLKVNLNKLRQQRMITPDGERTPISENFRRIKRPLLANVASPKSPPGANLIMITSPLPEEGKTFCAINLAISIAMEMDRTVLLVDADVARPSVTTVLGVRAESEKGLMDVLLDHAQVTDVLCRTDIGKLSILPAGTSYARATEMLASEKMGALLQDMAERYHDRIIIFDSPPLLAASEAAVLASRMGQILVVVEAGRTTETALKDALSRIESSHVVGVLLNKGAPPGAGYYGGYGYGYGYSA